MVMTDTYPFELIQHIRDYLDFLRNEHGLLTTYHLVEFSSNAESLGNNGNLDIGTIYREHTHPLCSYFKSKLNFWDHCIERQQKIVDKLQHGSFCGMCWAGITEFIYPIRNSNNKITSFVCVSGYCVDREKAIPRIKHVCETYNFSYEKAINIFDNSIYKSLPDKRKLDTLINPLCDMLSLLMTYLAKTKGLKGAADAIKAAGYEPGIWIGPFMVGEESKLFKEHPDWMLRPPWTKTYCA